MSKKIILYNVNATLALELSKVNTIVPLQNINKSVNVVFIDWIPTRKKPNKEMIEQIQLTEFCVKNNIKLVIFDRHRGITNQEFSYLKKHRTVFLEPTIINREGFLSHPLWLRVPKSSKDMSIKPFLNSREFDLGFVGDSTGRISGIDTFFSKINGYGDYNVTITSKQLSDLKKLEYEEFGIDTEKGRYTPPNMRFTVIVDTPAAYTSGFMNSTLITALENNVIPLLPDAHRFYHSMFRGFVVENEMDVARWLNVPVESGFGCTVMMAENILKYFPEMEVKNNAKILTKHF
jgi:hypothetical protein